MLWKTSCICHELKVNWSKMAIDCCGHCDCKRCPVSQQLQEFLTPGSSTEPRTLLLSHHIPGALQGPWGWRGCTEGAHLEQAGVISASGPGPTSQFTLDCGDRAAPSEPPSSWAILAHLFMPTLVAIHDLAGRLQWQSYVFPSTLRAIQRAGIQSVSLAILALSSRAQIYYSPKCFDKWKLLPHFFAIAALNHQKQKKDLLWMLNLHWPLQASDLLGAAVSLLTCFLQECSH